jgi:hypothetical protein
MKLPVNYTKLTGQQRRLVREAYIKKQDNLCVYCNTSLHGKPPDCGKKINWDLFPPNFLNYPIHIQHNHDTDMTEGAVHAYCNAVLWQYHNR